MRYALLKLFVFIPALLTGCNDGVSDIGKKTSQEWGRVANAPINYEIETVTSGLDHPWSMAFLNDGGFLVTERIGVLNHISATGTKTPILDLRKDESAPVHTRPGMQAGLFDVSLHPEFATTRWVYLTYAAEVKDGNTLLLNRYTLGPDNKSLSDKKTLFTAIPARIQSNHFGGRITWQNDGTLLLTHGDAFHFREKAQDLDNHFGKIMRLNDDGTVPTDNPFVGQDKALDDIWTYGHRNQQGLITLTDGRVLEHEHGPAGGDEINVITAGKNYGWPVASYGLDYSGARISPFEAYPETEQSVLHFTPSIAPSGFTQYHGDKFPEWNGGLFIGALVLKHVRYIDMKPDGSFGPQTELFTELDRRFRDIRTGKDGYLYLLTETKGSAESKLLRVIPKQ